MRHLLALPFLVFGLAASGGPAVVRGYGMSVTIPRGWHGTISHGLVRASGDGLRFEIRESTPKGKRDPFFRRTAVPTVQARDFASAEHHLGFTLSGRQFALLPFPARRPSAAALASVNAVLGSFSVKPGNYYGDVLAPARFPAHSGWFVGARGGRLLAEGGQTETWASTVPYGDEPLQIPPQRTLGRLPREGVIIWISLSRDSALRLRPWNSLHLARRLIGSNFEGLPRDRGLYRALVRRRSFDLDLWVFFGSVRPGPRVVAQAQAELDRLQLPTWPSG